MITGSTNGIGFGLAQAFLDKGHLVVVNGRTEQSLQTALGKLSPGSGEILGVPGDVNQPGTIQRILNETHKRFGRIDVWINNAGIPQPFLTISEMPEEEMDKLIHTNVVAVIKACQQVSRYMLEQGYGRIYNMEGFGSDGRMMEKLTLYGTSKRAVSYFTRAWYREIRQSGIRLGTINPGMVNTRFLQIDRGKQTDLEAKQYEKVRRILAENPEKVCPWIAERILNARKPFDAIRYLSGFRLFGKLVRLIFAN